MFVALHEHSSLTHGLGCRVYGLSIRVYEGQGILSAGGIRNFHLGPDYLER